ncbi:MAG: pyridoxine 5'-phosphate synthase [Candidatus Ratteibacteria bacterium]|nr:pyridoxine 5'-phosphate synthase [Candidatus Ratteibacteria bacterium]
MPALCVNIDHIATLREARGGKEPEPLHGALICEKAGADGITFHLREDRRHIQDKDVGDLRENIRSKLNMEMAAISEMVKIAKKVKVDQATLVPEKRRELTTEGGLDVSKQKDRFKKIVKNLKSDKILVSLFIAPELNQIRASSQIGADAVEIHTGAYCNTRGREQRQELEKIKKAARFAKSLGLRVFAGHGLNYRNAKNVAAIAEIEELNIGHSVISRAVFKGLETAVKDMRRIVK